MPTLIPRQQRLVQMRIRDYGRVTEPMASTLRILTKFVRVLANNGRVGSMGRVGACGDNAAMESFFSLVQNNVLDTRRWASPGQ